MLDFSNDPHRRLNILTGKWVLVSPHRTKRPWQGKEEVVVPKKTDRFDTSCYLCAGNTRANGEVNPAYKDTYVFTNDFAAMKVSSNDSIYESGLLKAKGETGICRVLCFSPDHSLTLADMPKTAIEKVIQLWMEEYKTLGQESFINHVQIFENKGAIMGCSNPHPHGQVWAQQSIPEEVLAKTESQEAYYKENSSSLLGDYLKEELALEMRIINQNEHFVSLVPFWAVWPYEAMIIPKRAMQSIDQMLPKEQSAFAHIIKDLCQRYDQVFDCPFPYSSGIHQKPTDEKEHKAWHWHMSFYPPLLRSATVKKFMVGYELFANPQRDLSAEQAAKKLRSFS